MNSPYLFIASMSIDSAHEDLFNEVYELEHIPAILRVSGVESAVRFRTRVAELLIGGQRRQIPAGEEPLYHAIFGLSNPAVLVSPGWSQAIEAGRWPSEVRPFTSNRRHLLIEKLTGTP